MKTIFFLSNVRNSKSNYLSIEYVTSNLVSYIGDVLSEEFKIVFLNIGAPKERWPYNGQYFYEYNVNKNQTIVEFSYGLFSKLPDRFKVMQIKHNAFKYLKEHYNNCDKIIIYHSLGMMKYYHKILSMFGTSNVVILAAELYSDVELNKYNISNEIKHIKPFKKIISMSSGIINKCFSNDGHSNVVYIYGSYKNLDISKSNKSDNKIHVVYAGTSSLAKKGFLNSLKASNFLTSNIVLHIYSKISDETRKTIEKQFPNARYEGYVEENELYKIISYYDIGLATQDPLAKFNESSFPSKITNYFACGLNVVSSKSISVINSPFSKYVYFYDEDEIGKNLANAIIDAAKKIDKDANQKIIRELDIKFQKEVKELLEK